MCQHSDVRKECINLFIKNSISSEYEHTFELAPVFSTSQLVNRAREFVDEWSTFRNYKNYTYNYNFRNSCIRGIFLNNNSWSMVGVEVSELTYQGSDFLIRFYKDGKVSVAWSDTSTFSNSFVERVENCLKYGLH